MDWLSLICSKSLIIKHRQIYSLSDENLNIYRLQVCPLNEFYLPINKAVTSLSGIDISCLSTISLKKIFKSQSESGQGRQVWYHVTSEFRPGVRITVRTGLMTERPNAAPNLSLGPQEDNCILQQQENQDRQYQRRWDFKKVRRRAGGENF